MSKQLCHNLKSYAQRCTKGTQRAISQAIQVIREQSAEINAQRLRIAYLEERLNDQRQYIEQQDATLGALLDAATRHVDVVGEFLNRSTDQGVTA